MSARSALAVFLGFIVLVSLGAWYFPRFDSPRQVVQLPPTGASQQLPSASAPDTLPPAIPDAPKVQDLTLQQLRAQLARAKDLNERKDFSLVTSGSSYSEDVGTFHGKTVEFAYKCWGDVCPDNGAYFLSYKDVSRDECTTLEGHIIEGNSGWGGMTYGGCSPIQ